jgi:hypothetical protein
MPGGEEFSVFVDRDQARKEWSKDKDKWKAYVAKHLAKTAVKSGVASVVNHFTMSVGGAIFEAPALYNTGLHIKHLSEIQTNGTTYPCQCEEVEHTLTCDDILKYTIEQKKKKASRRAVGTIPVLGTAAALKAKIHAVTKTDRGGKREQYAKILREKAHNDCPKAQAIVAELLGSYRSQDSWKEMFSVVGWDEGWKVLKDKMAST